MYHLMLGVYQEQALDQEPDFSQARLEVSLKGINPLKYQERTVEQAEEVWCQVESDLVVLALGGIEEDKAGSLLNRVMAISVELEAQESLIQELEEVIMVDTVEAFIQERHRKQLREGLGLSLGQGEFREEQELVLQFPPECLLYPRLDCQEVVV